MDRSQKRALVRREKDRIEPGIQGRYQQAQRTQRRADQLWNKYDHDLETLDAQERTMYQLDNTKDQLMSVLKLMLVNLVMWVRDRCFPADYAHATLKRLLPFFRLPGRNLTFDDRLLVTLRPFNDRALNRDLAGRVLPSGKLLILRLPDSAAPTSNVPP